ncbi:MAG: gamma-glutamylcyclotransferase [Bryobacterales bacterium]|nr:gamma-glutamylcyclotransferase [Bryobacterales bacterium]
MTSIDPFETRASGRLRLFVYGTLKRGFANHEHFCQGLLDFHEAEIRGRLYDGPGFPLLQVPGEDILAEGTGRAMHDLAVQLRAAVQVRSSSRSADRSAVTGSWDTVYGELFSFSDPEARLPAIDRLEGFNPGHASLDRRVLVPVVTRDACEVTWVYVVETPGLKERRLYSGRWPEV